ncbi:putative O-linked N-acetylglucosamine transferase (SPINDLY family) [Agrobacterium vitis]|nr:putative O-linked N-acetylglucosamine transferase (SPINDLY family) [Agrobacterium vitis]MBE1440512.1 putative O-linked N-acetylglucosamine transferase (SPINDLY family) [Agrobacterium vitis]
MTALYHQARKEFEEGAYDQALSTISPLLQPDHNHADAYILAATIHERRGDRLQAARLFENVIDLTPSLKREVAFRACQYYIENNQAEHALAALLKLHRHLPDDVDVNHSICSLYREAARYPDAVPYAEKLAVIGRDFDNWLNAGMVLLGTGQVEKAFPVLKAAYDARPTERLALTELFWCAISLCEFELSNRLKAELEQAYAADGMKLDIRENVFRSLHWSGDEAYHVLSAIKTAETHMGKVAPRRPYAPRSGQRLRIGYVSCDFYDHATMLLLAGVLEGHNRDRFEVYGICHTPKHLRKGPMRQRFMEAVEHFVDIVDLDDDAAGAVLRGLELDILIDLKGFTFGNRLSLFCRRPAPVQVSYLGFPGSVVGVGIDYAIADRFVVPPSSEQFYAEKIIRLPNSYQANDSKRIQVSREGPRSAHGLPEDGVVFCSFNQTVKLRHHVFLCWLEILKSVDGSVLWLLDMRPTVRENLRKEALKMGVDPDRIIFAPKKSMSEHIQRLCYADIALDTSPCNGHTTTADALWAGVPVVTVKGTSFASRVSESLLNAVGLPELVANDMSEFGRLATELAQDGVRQFRLRQHLIDARRHAPLFDTARFARDFEAALEEICMDAARP